MKKLTFNILNIPNPCSENWEKMTGTNTKKYCTKCSHSVINISELTELTAKKFINKNSNNKICVRYTQKLNGQIVFKESIIKQFLKRSYVIGSTILAVFGLSLNSYSETCSDNNCTQEESEIKKMGKPMLAPSPEGSPVENNEKVMMGAPAINPTEENNK